MKSGPIKWHGGKAYQAEKIISLMPPRVKNPNAPAANDKGWLHYVEPYFGGGAVLLALDPEGISEVANDKNCGLVNFWRVLADASTFSDFQRTVEAMPFSEDDYKKAAQICGIAAFDSSTNHGKVLLAAEFFVACRQSLSGRMKGFASITRNRTRKGMNEQVSAWLNAVEGLPEVHARLKRVLILNRPALDVIRQQDGERTLFYLDPPYLHETRVTTGEYLHEMSEAEHAALLGALEGIKGRFLLSGYPSALYDAAALRNGWHCTKFLIDNKSSSAKTKEKKTECVWTNFKPGEPA